MKNWVTIFLCCIILSLIYVCGCVSTNTNQQSSSSKLQTTTPLISVTPTLKPIIIEGVTGDRLYSVGSDKTDDKLDLNECADMAVAEWYTTKDRQGSATFVVGNLKRMPQNLMDIEDVWILTKNNQGQSLVIVPRDHVEILQYESNRVYANGAPIARPPVFRDFMNHMYLFKDKVRKYNEWMNENLNLLSPSGSANLDESMKIKWQEKYQKEKEIDELVDLLNDQLNHASFAIYPPFGSNQSIVTQQPTVLLTPVSSSTIAKPFIAASLKSSVIQRGNPLMIGGVAEGGAQYVYINIFSMDGTSFPTKVFTAPVQSDGWYELTLDSNAFPKGQYGVTLELPTGEYTKLQFLVE